ncbi:TIGR02444 family protein [Pseudoalteromonas sp. MMG010]|uniref:TIGR02444 family protein n=1 Tax=Pseudoalteromonas sp. MMG010 TaxID=2822685 RepID=UPI001B3A777E|nr:TIGR02444 family protein [Pseudoalteromonas sp. MMG010]MBQ4834288.1 TIGR02444 family protein [Pseudoalteromonas sp. MMG010]
MNLLNKDAFWQFACTLYAEPQQQTTLLAMQDQQGKNVNLCLLLFYLDSLKLSINNEQLACLINAIALFDTHALQPLRSARYYLKSNKDSIPDYALIRKELLSAELKLEKQQQHILINTVNEFTLLEAKNPNNIELYIKA